ncbi:uncharacterized protein LOC119582239 [Penaeus monodon]|uniref:uncharacterized protein LOC119582239 n=1 Tax=Penaeus monodon TaxID=6687 RepID=UPI0018A74EEA|nr:uncharacterized protein LOC119582239 [Penaeus monodon]
MEKFLGMEARGAHLKALASTSPKFKGGVSKGTKSQKVPKLYPKRDFNKKIQKDRWRGQKAKVLENGYKLYYMGEDNRTNGVGVVLSSEMKEGIVQVKQEVRKVGRTEEEKDDFWDLLGGVMMKIPDMEVVCIMWNLNGHGEGSFDTEVKGKYRVGTRNEGGDRIVAVVNTYFQKKIDSSSNLY